MKTTLLILIIASLAAGCSSGTKTVETTLPDGQRATVTQSADGMKVEGNGMDASVGGAAKVTEEDLHIKIYPGSTLIADRSMKVKSAIEENAIAFYSSTDDPAKIAKFFEEQLGGSKFNEYKSGEAVNYIVQKDNPDGSKLAIAITRKSPSVPVEISIGYGKESKKS